MDDKNFESSIRERILHPDRLVFTRWEKTESTFVWKIENFTSFKKVFRGTPIQIVFKNLKNHEGTKLTLKIQHMMTDRIYYSENFKEYYLIGFLKVSSPNEINKLLIRTYIVGQFKEKLIDIAEVSGILPDSEENIILFSMDDHAMDYGDYLQNDTLTLAFSVTELKVESK